MFFQSHFKHQLILTQRFDLNFFYLSEELVIIAIKGRLHTFHTFRRGSSSRIIVQFHFQDYIQWDEILLNTSRKTLILPGLWSLISKHLLFETTFKMP